MRRRRSFHAVCDHLAVSTEKAGFPRCRRSEKARCRRSLDAEKVVFPRCKRSLDAVKAILFPSRRRSLSIEKAISRRQKESGIFTSKTAGFFFFLLQGHVTINDPCSRVDLLPVHC